MVKTYQLTDYIDFKNALIDKYGAGVTIHYNSATSVIFSIPAISNKVFRIYNTSLYGQYGTSWTSGDSINNPINFGGTSYNVAPGTNWILILADNFLVVSKSNNARVHIIGKLTNGESICMGLYYSSSQVTGCEGYQLSNGEKIFPIGINGIILSGAGEIYTHPLFFATTLNQMLMNLDGSIPYKGLTNPDSNFAYIDGVFCSSYQAGATSILATDYWLSSSGFNMVNRNNALTNSIVVPLI